MIARVVLPGVLFAMFVGAACAEPARRTIVVAGESDRATDRRNIQKAVDAARPGDTVELVGTFLLDGRFVSLEKPRLTLRGRAADDDGDGKVNEDWADGLDNDGDGSTDEDDWDAALVGIEVADGAPDPGPPLTLFNRAIVIDALPGPTEQVVIRDIKFSTFRNAIDFSADHSVPDGALCAEIVKTPGVAIGPVVQSNWFHNNRRGVQVFGAATGATIRNNLFTENTTGVLVVGGEAYCRAADGSDSSFAVGSPEETRISGNRVVTSGFGIISTQDQSTRIDGNQAVPEVHPPE